VSTIGTEYFIPELLVPQIEYISRKKLSILKLPVVPMNLGALLAPYRADGNRFIFMQTKGHGIIIF